MGGSFLTTILIITIFALYYYVLHVINTHTLDMITLAGHLIACLFWGLLIALTLTGICILIARSYTNKGVNPLICIVLSIFILYQSVLAVGAMYAKGLVQDIHDTVENVAETAGGMLSYNEISRQLKEHFPDMPQNIQKNIADTDTANSITSQADMIAGQYISQLNGYILKRLYWALGFMAIGTILLIIFPYGGKNRKSKGGNSSIPAWNKYDVDF